MPPIFAVWIYLSIVLIDAQQSFLNEPASSGTECTARSYNFRWNYEVTPNDAFTVEWKKGSKSILTWYPDSDTYVFDSEYSASKIVHNDDNGDITIKDLTLSDAGTYHCKVTYDVSGFILTSNTSVLVTTSCPTVTTEMSYTSSTIEQTTSSKNPSTDTSQTQKIETTIMNTTDNDLTSTFWHVTSDVTTLTKTDSDNSIELTVGTIIAITISGTMVLVLIIILIICCRRYCIRKHSIKHTSEKYKARKTNENKTQEVPEFRQTSIGRSYEMNGSSHDTNQQFREYNRGTTSPSYYPANYYNFPQTRQNQNYLPRDYNQICATNMPYVHAVVPHDSQGYIFYKGQNRDNQIHSPVNP